MFQLVFKGECTPGTDPATARSNARTLFKATVDQIERMFSGQPVVIRNKLEEVQAEKYRSVLQKHGMVAYVQPMEGSVASTTSRAAPAAQPSSEPKPAPAAPPAGAAGSGDGPGSAVAVEPGDRLPVWARRSTAFSPGPG